MSGINYFGAARRVARNLATAQLKLAESSLKISTGKRINRAADDPAGLSIARKFSAQITSLSTSYDNIQSANSLLSTIDGALDEISSILQRMNTLANQAANDTLTTSDRQLLQVEMNGLISEIDRISTAAEFNSIKLLTGNYSSSQGSILIQVGANTNNFVAFNINTASSQSLGVSSIDITSTGLASSSINLIQSGIYSLSSLRANVGGITNRLSSSSNIAESMRLELDEARSNIEDTDYAEEMINYLKLKMLAEVGATFLAQANMQTNSILDLIKSLNKV